LESGGSARIQPHGANLQGADLYQANLLGVDLVRANLHSANLQRANLKLALLHLANLQDAYLDEVNLWFALLSETNLGGARLRKGNLEHTNLHRANLHGADLTDATLQRALLHNANLQGADLAGVNLQGAIRLIRAHEAAKWADGPGFPRLDASATMSTSYARATPRRVTKFAQLLSIRGERKSIAGPAERRSASTDCPSPRSAASGYRRASWDKSVTATRNGGNERRPPPNAEHLASQIADVSIYNVALGDIVRTP
jgi:hypothetical protein